MKILVKHTKYNRESGAIIGYTDVAEVNIAEVAAFADENECLEYAYRWTNNVMGSWSIKEQYLPTRKGEPALNGDYNKDVTVLAPRPDGMGQRSTMMGDHMIVIGESDEIGMQGSERYYEVCAAGFKMKCLKG
jgi:hypothetical protein|tara:strand:+ start:44 stop:442 length:399 start_codon:yes stop_codon:yes gene_type:complete